MAGSFAAYVDDRPADKVFRVDRAIYLDDAVFAAEIANIFEATWQFVCHESQIPNHGDYFANHLGRQPIFVMRQQDGGIGGFVNACAHRGALLTPMKQGNAKTLTCRFHGWTYGSDGHCIRIKNEETGYDPARFRRTDYDLTRLPRVEAYRGFVFACLNPAAPALVEFLGEAARFLEFIAHQSADGMEVLPGSSTYVINGNWKLQSENAVDGYHVSTVHRVFGATVARREERPGYDGMMRTESGRIAGKVENGCYDLGGGHMVIWADRSPPDTSPLFEQKDRLERDYGAAKARWMLGRGRNLIVFPSLMINDFAATQIRTFRPIAADRTEVTIYCLAPRGESKSARYARLRKFEDFFLVSGMATADDVMALEDSQTGSRGRTARWGEFHRGLDSVVHGPDAAARDGKFNPVTSNNTWDQETLYHGFYRRWKALMTTEAIGAKEAAE
ncbi:MAG: Rieske 2Fe-2S domain-containing protein [Alphaproteobacteria bacterium]|nr:Rieske 2Fe-2S domain-containing protein [Alphaproteobacteria bacterium]